MDSQRTSVGADCDDGADDMAADDCGLEVAALRSVLEDAVNQLSILAHTSRAAKLAPDLATHTLHERHVHYVCSHRI